METFAPFTLEGQEYSVIASGLEAKIFRAVDLGALQSEPGWIYDGEGRMEPWKLEGMTEVEGKVVFYGPLVQGTPFSPENLTLEEVTKIAAVLQILEDQKNTSYTGFYSKSWFFLADGRVLLLPAGLMDFIRKAEVEKERMVNWYPYNHPDRPGREGFSFTLAILACRVLAGIHP